MTTENDLIGSKLLQDKCPLLVEAARLIADPQVRNNGTIGGDIAHGDPGNDHPALMLALDASLRARRARRASASCRPTASSSGPTRPLMEPGEILTEIRIPIPAPSTGSCYEKLKRKTGDFATAAAAVVLRMKGETVVRHVAIALTNVGADRAAARAAEDSAARARR